MEQVKMEAARREVAGKGPARQSRREGRVPGVVYGLGHGTVSLSVPRSELDHAVKVGHGSNVLIDLTLDGEALAEDVAAVIKKIERQPITREPLCVDFMWVSLKELLTVNVNVVLKGRAAGQEFGGIVEQSLHTIPVRCLPINMPEEVPVELAPLKIGDSIYIRDLPLPEGVELLTDPDAIVVHVAAPNRAPDATAAAEEELPEDVAAE